MNKIIVIGSPGAGKSEFSRKLNKILNIPLFCLDNIWWNSDRTHISRIEFDNKLSEIILLDKWIIDGDYSRTYEKRFNYADTIFFLDYSLDICLDGVESRVGKKRDDLPWVEEKFDDEFKKWIINWHQTVRNKVIELIQIYRIKKDIFIFKSREEATNFLKNLV
ncbi:MAG: adenylate kinase [Anaeroplasma sp.]